MSLVITLLVVVIVLIQCPPVQQKLVHVAAKYISDKTKTKVLIGEIGISFPKSVYLKNIFLDDQQRDTLLSAGYVEADINFINAIKGNIHINNIKLENVVANIYTRQTDSLYNFNFIIEAFAGNKKQVKDTTTKSKTLFALDNASLKNIRLNYLDSFNDLLLSGNFKTLSLSADKTDLDNLDFKISRILIADAVFSVEIPTDKVKPVKENKTVSSPKIFAMDIEISRSSFVFKNIADSMLFNLQNLNFETTDLNADLNTNKFEASLVKLSGSKTAIFLNKTTKKVVVLPDQEIVSPSVQMHVKLKRLQIENNSFNFSDASQPAVKSFDGHHMKIDSINVDMAAINFGGTQDISASISKIALKDDKGFILKNLSGKAIFTKDRLGVSNLILQTAGTRIKGNADLSYSSFDSLQNKLADAIVNIELSPSVISHADLLYFVPSVNKISYFNEYSTTGLETEISGPVKNLNVKQLHVDAAGNTSLNTAFSIKGLPEIKSAELHMPDAVLLTTASDIHHLLPQGSIPDSIHLPQQIKAIIAFNGSLQNFSSNVNLNTTLGELIVSLELKNQNSYRTAFHANNFNAGQLLGKENQIGSITMSGKINGSGIKPDRMVATASLNIESVGYNHYVYHKINVDATADNQVYSFGLNVDDSNVIADIKGNITTGRTTDSISINGSVSGIDLNKLHFTEKDLRLGGTIAVGMQRDTSTGYITGGASVSQSMIKSDDKNFLIDTLLILDIARNKTGDHTESNALADLHIGGNIDPVTLSGSMTAFLNNYFFIDSVTKKQVAQQFDFSLRLNNHPVISAVFLKDMHSFVPGEIKGSYDSETAQLQMNAEVKDLQYKSILVNNADLKVNTNENGLLISLTADNLKSDPLNIYALDFNVNLHNQQADIAFNTGTANDSIRTAIAATIKNINNEFHLVLDKEQTINSQVWSVPQNNELVSGKNIFTINNFSFNQGYQQLSINKKNANDSLEAHFQHFNLVNLSKLINKDSVIVQGSLNGDFALAASGGLDADISLDSLQFRSVQVGTLLLKAKSSSNGSYNLQVNLSGNENDVSVAGSVSTEKNNQSMNLVADLKKLNMKTLEAFSMGQISESSGFVDGKLTATGSFSQPVLEGKIHFLNASTTPQLTNIKIILKDETISITDQQITFPDFTIRDEKNNSAILTGQILKKGFSDFRFNLLFKTADFTLLNTTKKPNDVFYGSVIADCNLKLTGDITVPIIEADISIKKGTHFTYAIPQAKGSTDKGEGVILFTDTGGVNAILTNQKTNAPSKQTIKGYEISTNLRIDPEAVLTVVIDPVSGDSLTVQGTALLSFSLDQGGKVSLTGRYELSDGSYLVSLQQLIRKRFEIQHGSSITFNGDPLDADVDIHAIYHVTTSPVDLIANQVEGLSEEELRTYRQRLPFEVNLSLQDKLLTPLISFSIDLPEEYRAAMGGVVYSKLTLLKDDPSELNKQVFALLIFNRFIQQDPLASSSGGGAESVARTSVSKFLTQQLNQLSAQYIKGVELNVDVQSYDNSTDPQSSGTTEVELGVKKNFFKDRLSVQVGGTVDVEGSNQQGNQSNDISGNATVEYKITPDGRLRFKGFRQNEYAGFIEGLLVETGVGLIYTKDFGKWKDVIRSSDKKND